MQNYFKTIISLPLALILSGAFFHLSNLSLAYFENIYFDWIFFILKVIIPYSITGFILMFTFLYLCEAKNISLEIEQAFLSLIKVFYGYLIIYLLVIFYLYGFPSNNYNLTTKNNILISNSDSKYILFGAIVSIVLYFRSFHKMKIPMSEQEIKTWDEYGDYDYVQRLIEKKQWRKLNYFLDNYYLEDISDERINFKELKKLVNKKL